MRDPPALIELAAQRVAVKPPCVADDDVDHLPQARQKYLRIAQLQFVHPLIKARLIAHIAVAFGYMRNQIVGKEAMAFVALIIGAGMKISYDILLYFSFRGIKPPEER